MKFKFGPAGLGGVKEAVNNLEHYHKLGLTACEIAFTYGVYIHKKEDAEEIEKAAKKLGIKLSIHAPYWINLNSKEKKKTQESMKRILDCCETGELLGANLVVFHPGYYGGMDKEQTFQNIKKAILKVKQEIKKHKWKINIAAETTGKINVFGSVDETERLVHETGCSFCIDFAHILAREKKIDFKYILSKLKSKELHIHFSGIEYGEKGERRHIKTNKEKLKDLLLNLKKYAESREIVIINESPYPIEDSVLGLKLV
ncbi:MAG: TIM barrel protein [Candidatus Aenigmarchaeota archaeon]|nr:TIM barrel protein [Candidatus Aenigmarchaeota archaeon]